MITRLIVSELAEGPFSALHFYERRVRRIIPPLLVVTACCFVAAAVLFMPLDFRRFSASAMATTLFSANIWFWQTSEYFASASALEPLLHMWSLAVEEQFYVVYPALLVLAIRFTGRAWPALVAALALASFVAKLTHVQADGAGAFYLAHYRAWELLLGALLASGVVPVLRLRALRELCAIAGALLVATSVGTGSSFVGGPHALSAVLGTALLIHAGSGANPAITRWLSAKPLVFVGLVSYGWYLWHWPLLAFPRYFHGGALGVTEATAAVVVSFVLAVLSWRWVEQPIRRKPPAIGRTQLFAGAAGISLCALAAGAAGYLSDGWPGRFPGGVAQLAAGAAAGDPRRGECVATPRNWIEPQGACRYGAAVAPVLAVWGDSHAISIGFPLGNLAARHGQSLQLFSYAGCPPVLEVRRGRRADHRCAEFNAAVLAYLRDTPALARVILIARHAQYVHGAAIELGPAEQGDTTITDLAGTVRDEEGRKRLYATQFQRTVDALVAAGKQVILVYPVPEVGRHVPLALARLKAEGRAPEEMTASFDWYRERNRFVFELLDGAGPALVRIRPHERLCSGATCRVYADGNPLYFDDDHLSVAGGAYVLPLFEPLFEAP